MGHAGWLGDGSFAHVHGWLLWLKTHAHGWGALLLGLFTEKPDLVSSTDAYAERFAGPVGRWMLRIQCRSLMKQLRPWPRADLLDVGGGHGQYTRALADAGHDVTVLGSAPETMRRIESLVRAGRCRFVVGDLLRLPYADQSFDIVISFRQLAHLDQWQPWIEELCRVARRAVILDFPPRRSFNRTNRLLFPLKRILENRTTRRYRVLEEADVVRVFQQQGFTPTGRIAQFCLPMVLHRTLRWPRFSRTVERALWRRGWTERFGSPVILRCERAPDDPCPSAPAGRDIH